MSSTNTIVPDIGVGCSVSVKAASMSNDLAKKALASVVLLAVVDRFF